MRGRFETVQSVLLPIGHSRKGPASSGIEATVGCIRLGAAVLIEGSLVRAALIVGRDVQNKVRVVNSRPGATIGGASGEMSAAQWTNGGSWYA